MRLFWLITAFSICLKAALPNEYYDINNFTKKKTYFINHIYRIIETQNNKILKDREFLKYQFEIRGILNFDFSEISLDKLNSLKEQYRISSIFNYEEFLLKVDFVPPALAISQAIVESGWGESRFAYEANNIFGQWTYSGDGLIPSHREDGSSHRLRMFETVEDSVYNYLLNINIGWGYKKLRQERFFQRQSGYFPSSLVLVNSLKNYSELGQAYIKAIKEVMRHNNLYRYDDKFVAVLKPVSFYKFGLSISY